MSIYAFTGAIGSGKSFYQLRFALEMCEAKEKQLVTNFPLDRDNLRKYAKMQKLKWVEGLLDYGGITEVHAPKSLDTLMLPNAVVCIDEAGVLLNSRSWKDTPKDFLADLCQSRKKATDLIYTAQFSEQVDSQMRMLTQYYVHADGLTYYDKKTKLPHLYYKRYYYFDAGKHRTWLAKNCGHLKTRLAFAYKYHGGFLTAADRLLFECFDSKTIFGKGRSFTKYESLDYCKLDQRPKTNPYFNQHDYERRANLISQSGFLSSISNSLTEYKDLESTKRSLEIYLTYYSEEAWFPPDVQEIYSRQLEAINDYQDIIEKQNQVVHQYA